VISLGLGDATIKNFCTLARHLSGLALVAGALAAQAPRAQTVPLPEHPRPDFERAEWLNLNGSWRFAFDVGNDGERAGWPSGALPG
jgi:hypothetical protein